MTDRTSAPPAPASELEPVQVDHLDGECCTDCLCLLANGDTPEHFSTEETDSYLSEVDRRSSGGLWVPNCPEDCEGSFSWSPCDVCGSTLGGDRHPVAWFPPPPHPRRLYPGEECSGRFEPHRAPMTGTPSHRCTECGFVELRFD